MDSDVEGTIVRLCRLRKSGEEEQFCEACGAERRQGRMDFVKGYQYNLFIWSYLFGSGAIRKWLDTPF